MKPRALTLKIIAGKYKNTSLDLPSLETTRSTKTILKESLFNTLQFDIVGANFVEVFGGSGSMGLEALSRGAAHAYFFEKDRVAFGILCANCVRISASHTSCMHADSFKEFPNFLASFKEKAYFYFDPPFSIRKGHEQIYNQTIKLIEMIPPKNAHMIIVEHQSSEFTEQTIGEYKLQKTKKFGKSSLSYYL